MNRQPNEQQKRVMEDLENNLILFASAGTGKTFTVAKRVAEIVQKGAAQAREILCLTFTTKACEEMRRDVSQYVGERAEEVEIRTIHGFCYQIFREEQRRLGDRYVEATVCDEVDAEELIKSILSSQYKVWEKGELERSDVGIEEDVEDETAFDVYQKKSGLRNFISALKHVREEEMFYTENDARDYQNAFNFLRRNRPEVYDEILSFRSKAGGQVRDERFERAMERFAGNLASTYDCYLRQSNRLDYDDLILYAALYLRQKEIQARWAGRYRYIIVDEMQDTSLLEYKVLKCVFGNNKLMLCGDFFQSIYEWRGSKPQIVLRDFIQTYAAKTYMFSENYRSTKTLANATFGYLCAVYPEFVGEYCPEKIQVNNADEGEKILCCGFDNKRQEALQIYNYIKKCAPKKPSDLCVIARSNAYIAGLARAFEEFSSQEGVEGLRFFTAEENLLFYRKPVIKDVTAVLRLLFNRSDRVSMERLTEKYVRLVGIKTIENLRLAHRLGVSIVSFLEKQTFEYKDPYHVLDEGFKNEEIVVYDTETTGLDLSKDELVQFSAIRLNEAGEVVATFDRMIIPSVEIGQGAYETHGFNLEYIRSHGGVSLKKALAEFAEFAKGGVLVGHNSSQFDAPLLARLYKENDLPPLEVKGEYDTLTIAKDFLSGLENYKLETLCQRYGIINTDAHNALGDILATGQVLHRLYREKILPTAKQRQRICEKLALKFEKFYSFMEGLRARIQKGELNGIIEEIVERMRMRKRYDTPADARAVKELSSIVDRGVQEKGEYFLRELLANADLTGSKAEGLWTEQNRIPILTVHQAKGCEFDVVILAGVDDTNFPNFFAKEGQGEEEEKKVFYVAITRARKRLILTKAAYNGHKALLPSRFVKAIPESYLWKNDGWEILPE